MVSKLHPDGANLPGQLVEAKPTDALRFPRVPVEVLGPERILRTPRLSLRRLQHGDWDQFSLILRDDNAYLRRGINVRHPGETIRTCFDRLLAQCASGDASGSAWRRVAILDDGRLAGMVHLVAIDHALLAKADAGWWIASACAGHGLATEAVGAMVRHAFGDLPLGLGLIQLDAAIEPTNRASQIVASRAGFSRREGESTRVQLGEGFVEHEVWRAVVRLGD